MSDEDPIEVPWTAVLDAVDQAVVFSDAEGTIKVLNRAAGDLFGLEREAYIGAPKVALLRSVALTTDDPEGFMEAFQKLRDDPRIELHLEIDQILPKRRKLDLRSAAAYAPTGALIGRIDTYTDVTEHTQRAAEVERLYDQARRTAESFQRSLLPDSIPILPRVSLVAHYVAAAGRRAVCGDFYDFVPLRDGRVGLVIGDVCGVGPAAASDAALARYTLRSFSNDIGDPAAVLERLNRHLVDELDSERFVRIVFGILDPERASFEYAIAGHVPPVRYRARAGVVDRLGGGDVALGVDPTASYETGRIDLDPGDMLVLYTDGVTEAPRFGRPLGQGRFSDLVREYGVGTPGEFVQAIRRAVQAWISTDLRDDLAIIACQVVPDAALAEAVRELVLPNEPARLRDVRRFVGAFLADLRAPVDAANDILLAVGEAAANASRHGVRPEGTNEMRISCAAVGPTVMVTVADEGPGFDPAPVGGDEPPDNLAPGGRGLFLMRHLMDAVDVDSSSSGTTVTLMRRIGPHVSGGEPPAA